MCRENRPPDTSFEYNEDGLRQKKTVNGTETDYFYNGSVLIGMQRSGTRYLFSYDAAGNVVSVKYNNNEYYYVRNGQGDIVKLIDSTGTTVVEYIYNTWGKKVTTTGSLAGTLGLIQPFRYRGYVYDYETGFYYLQSRYYDPTTGRFISADVFLSTGQGVLGHNCYAYCLDNPVRYYDIDGFEACGIDIQDDPDNYDPEEDGYSDDMQTGFDSIEELPKFFLSKSRGRGRETDFRGYSDKELEDLYKWTHDTDLKKKIEKEQKNRIDRNVQKRKSNKNLPTKRQPNRKYMVENIMLALPVLFVAGACIAAGYKIAKSRGGGSLHVFCFD